MCFITSCPSCGQGFTAEDVHLGMEIKCTHCSLTFTVRKPLPIPMAMRVKKDPPKYAMDPAAARKIVEEKESQRLETERQKEDQIDKAIETLCDEVRTEYISKNALETFTLALQDFDAAFKKLDKLTDIVDERNKNGRSPVTISNGYKDLLVTWGVFTSNKLNPSVNSFYTSDFLNLIVDLNGKIIAAFSKMNDAFHALPKPTQNKIQHAYVSTLDLVNENLSLLKVAISTSEEDATVWGAQISRLKNIPPTLNNADEIKFMEISLLKSWSEVLELRSSVERAKSRMISYLGVLKKTLN
jgi:hypothetical protein